MRLGLLFAMACALALHASVLLFGGGVFAGHGKDHGRLQQVQLLNDKDAAAQKEKPKDKPKDQEAAAEKKDAMEADNEQAPDAAEMIRNIELSAAASAPALEAASLGAIEAALSGQAGGGDFGESLTFSSGGRIGGTAKAGATQESLEQAFNLGEIDQRPNVVHQTGGVYPASLRGRKIEGVVTVLFVVDATGKVVEPRVEKSSHPAFEKPAIDAVRQWKFEPAVKAGQRVPCKMRVPIRFQPR